MFCLPLVLLTVFSLPPGCSRVRFSFLCCLETPLLALLSGQVSGQETLFASLRSQKVFSLDVGFRFFSFIT